MFKGKLHLRHSVAILKGLLRLLVSFSTKRISKQLKKTQEMPWKTLKKLDMFRIRIYWGFLFFIYKLIMWQTFGVKHVKITNKTKFLESLVHKENAIDQSNVDNSNTNLVIKLNLELWVIKVYLVFHSCLFNETIFSVWSKQWLNYI